MESIQNGGDGGSRTRVLKGYVKVSSGLVCSLVLCRKPEQTQYFSTRLNDLDFELQSFPKPIQHRVTQDCSSAEERGLREALRGFNPVLQVLSQFIRLLQRKSHRLRLSLGDF